MNDQLGETTMISCGNAVVITCEYINVYILYNDVSVISWYADNYYDDDDVEEKEWIVIRKMYTGIDYEDD